MFGDSIRDLVMILFNLICACVVILLALTGFKTARELGISVTTQRVETEYLQNEYRYSGIDSKEYTRDQVIAFILDNINTKDFEMSVRITSGETRATIEASHRLYDRDTYLNDTTDYTAEMLKTYISDSYTYYAYLCYKGEETTSRTSSYGTANRSDYITGIAFVNADL